MPLQPVAASVELCAHQRARLDPAAFGEPQAGRGDGYARMLGGFLALDELRIVGGQAGDGFALRLHLLVGAGEL